MALDSSVLSGLIRANLVGKLYVADNPALTELCDAIAQAVVAHITTSAVVLPLLLVAPGGGGPVTGTGTVE